ncbi:MAG: dethiobiotin synthase [Xanthomonadales bacterium]|nr:dethiobiotin synthase [Xanthomonadales bacterium]
MKRIFVTGTDTEVGKTWVASALARHLVSCGLQVAVMKPVASGCVTTEQGLRNEDALSLIRAANVIMPYEQVNPYAYEPAIAPHIAATEAGRYPDSAHIVDIADDVEADVLIVEGAGGWCVPLHDEIWIPDLVRALGAEVILVAGIKLGCINHAVLTARQIQADGLRLLGWVANQLDANMKHYRENRETIEKKLNVPMLCEVKWNSEKAEIRPETILG